MAESMSGVMDPARLTGIFADVAVPRTTFALSTQEGRIAAFLLEIERIARRTPGFRLTQGMIADAVGASRPKVNRCLKALERRAVVALRNGSIPEIRSRGALVGVL